MTVRDVVRNGRNLRKEAEVIVEMGSFRICKACHELYEYGEYLTKKQLVALTKQDDVKIALMDTCEGSIKYVNF